MNGCDQDRMYEVEWNQWMIMRIVPYCILINWGTSYCPPYIDICDSEKEHGTSSIAHSRSWVERLIGFMKNLSQGNFMKLLQLFDKFEKLALE